MKKGSLFLMPSPLGEDGINAIPQYVKETARGICEFIVENERTARRYISKLGVHKNIRELKFHLLDKHADDIDDSLFLKAAMEGKDICMLSEAGCPCVADPGASLVKLAHKNGIRVIPLAGPSAIILALMGSGFNGQNFVFHGYLPKDKKELGKKLREIEKESMQKNQTQLFIETPYRNEKLLKEILDACSPHTQLCIAADLTLPTEYIASKTISEWRKNIPDISRKPAVFLIYKIQ